MYDARRVEATAGRFLGPLGSDSTTWDKASAHTTLLPSVGSPTAGVPVRKGRALGAERGVAAVPGVEPGVIGEHIEDLALNVTDEAGEVGRVAPGVADAAGEGRMPRQEGVTQSE